MSTLTFITAMLKSLNLIQLAARVLPEGASPGFYRVTAAGIRICDVSHATGRHTYNFPHQLHCRAAFYAGHICLGKAAVNVDVQVQAHRVIY